MTKPTEQQFEGLRTIDKPEQPNNCNCVESRHLEGAVACPDCAEIEQSASAPSASKKKNTLDNEPETGVKNREDISQPLEQPSQNSMIFEQVNGSVKVALELLDQLETKDTNEEEQKQGCIWTLKGWRDNNLEHLQKALGGNSRRDGFNRG